MGADVLVDNEKLGKGLVVADVVVAADVEIVVADEELPPKIEADVNGEVEAAGCEENKVEAEETWVALVAVVEAPVVVTVDITGCAEEVPKPKERGFVAAVLETVAVEAALAAPDAALPNPDDDWKAVEDGVPNEKDEIDEDDEDEADKVAAGAEEETAVDVELTVLLGKAEPLANENAGGEEAESDEAEAKAELEENKLGKEGTVAFDDEEAPSKEERAGAGVPIEAEAEEAPNIVEAGVDKPPNIVEAGVEEVPNIVEAEKAEAPAVKEPDAKEEANGEEPEKAGVTVAEEAEVEDDNDDPKNAKPVPAADAEFVDSPKPKEGAEEAEAAEPKGPPPKLGFADEKIELDEEEEEPNGVENLAAVEGT